MLHPFEPFKASYIPRLLELKKHFLVTQTYHRYTDTALGDAKTSLLLTDYMDINLAKTHVQALPGDKYAALLNLQHLTHHAKLIELLGETSRFGVFWAVVKNAKELEDRINRTCKEHLKRFIEQHTHWRISRETVLRPSVELVFGELYVTLKYGSQTIRIKLSEIETA